MTIIDHWGRRLWVNSFWLGLFEGKTQGIVILLVCVIDGRRTLEEMAGSICRMNSRASLIHGRWEIWGWRCWRHWSLKHSGYCGLADICVAIQLSLVLIWLWKKLRSWSRDLCRLAAINITVHSERGLELSIKWIRLLFLITNRFWIWEEISCRGLQVRSISHIVIIIVSLHKILV